MRPVKNKWVVIQWIDGRWKPVTKKRTSFRDHIEEFNDLRDTAHLHDIPHHYRSIHVCWLDDIAEWDPPYEMPAGNMMDHVMNLTPHDRLEVRRFQKYLAARQKYGEAVLLKRKFWRKYLGVDE